MVVLPGWGDGADEGGGSCGGRASGGGRLLLMLLLLRLVRMLMLVLVLGPVLGLGHWRGGSGCEAARGWGPGVEQRCCQIAVGLGCVDGRGVGGDAGCWRGVGSAGDGGGDGGAVQVGGGGLAEFGAGLDGRVRVSAAAVPGAGART